MQVLIGAACFVLYVTSVSALFNRTHDSMLASALFIALVHAAVAIQIFRCFG